MKRGCCGFISAVADFVAGLPGAILYFKTPYVLSIIIYFVLILFVVGCCVAKERVVKKNIKKYDYAVWRVMKKFFIGYLIVVLIIDLGWFSRGQTRIYFVDVGQGDCSLIITSHNKKILIDRWWKL